MSTSTAHLLLPSGRLLVLPRAQDGAEKSDPQVAPQTQQPAQEQQPPGGAGETGSQQDGGRQTQTPPPGGGEQCRSMALLFVPFLLLMYFLMIRPQQKQEKARRAMLDAVRKGDRIVTSGGIHAQVASLEEQTVTVKFGSGDGQRMKIDRSAIARVLERGGDTANDT